MTATSRRIFTGIATGACWAAVLLFAPPSALFVALLICSSLCQWEFYKLAELGGLTTCRAIGVALGALWLSVCFAYPVGSGDFRTAALLLLFGGGLLLLTVLLFNPRVQRPIESAGTTLLGLFYVPFLLSFYIHLGHWGATTPLTLTHEGIFLAFFASLVVKMTDVGGYAVGMKFGKHKMFPRVSPAKSWEGLAGGLALAVACSVGVVQLAHCWAIVPVTPLSHVSLPVAAALGLLLGVVGVIGDLIESMFKRSAHTKDSGGVLPGLGGALDVFDSLLFAPAVMCFLLPLL